jgi:tetratricopeptide (TPR) repeat protein
MKAIDKDPKRRYQSADEMAEDLQSFVNDEPIKARRIGLVERLGRWCRRNPAVAGLTAAVLVLMAVGTTVSIWQAVVANLARADLAAKNRELAAEQAKVQERFELAQKAIALFHTGVSEDFLLKNAEFKELRTKLLKEAAGFYDDLKKLLEGQSDAKSRQALAAAYFQLGELTDKIGDKKEALAVHRKSLALRRELASAEGADVETRLDVARSLDAVGMLLRRTGDPAAALSAFQEERDLAAALEAEAPTDAVRAQLAFGHDHIGFVLNGTGEPAGALGSFREALGAYQKLPEAGQYLVPGQGPTFGLQLQAGTYMNIGWLLSKMGKVADGLESVRKASDIMEKLANANPTNISVQAYLAISYGNLGPLLAQTGRLEEARESLHKTLALFQTLADANPAVTELQSDLAWSHWNIGGLLSQTGKPEEAIEAHRKALVINQKLADANPTVPEYQLVLAAAHNNIGRLLARQKRFAEAFTHIDAALAIRRKLAEADPKTTMYTTHLGYSHAYRGWALVRSGQPSQAAADLRRALELWGKDPAPELETRFERSRALALLAGLRGEAKSGVTTAEAARFADQAVVALRDAINTGWAVPRELKEPDFDALRGLADFQKLVAQVEAKAEKK